MINPELMRSLEGALEIIDSVDAPPTRKLSSAYTEAFAWIDPQEFPEELHDRFDFDAMWAYMDNFETTEEDAEWVIAELRALHRRLQSY
jgi:hypothetical protein